VAAVAAELCAFVASDDALPSARGAVGFGVVTPRGGDYFGDVVNLVARATKAAEVNGIVATASVVTCLAPSQWLVNPPRTVELRGVGEVELYDVMLDG
jgi:class 3 adenylate cyclase